MQRSRSMQLASISLALALGLVVMIHVGGCAHSPVGPRPVTLLKNADPAAAELVAFLELRKAPLMSVDGGGAVRIEASAQSREALIRYMELAQLRIEICAANIANLNTTRDADGKHNPYRR